MCGRKQTKSRTFRFDIFVQYSASWRLQFLDINQLHVAIFLFTLHIPIPEHFTDWDIGIIL